MLRHQRWLLLLALTYAVGCSKQEEIIASEAGPGADLVVINADVYTVDSETPRVEAFAVTSGKFVALGNTDEIEGQVGANTTVIDAKGRTVVPGFVDGHTHLSMGVRLVHGVDLYGIAEKDIWLERIAQRASELGPGEWLMGGRWDHSLSNIPLPTRQDIDSVVDDRPVALQDVDGHSAWLNTKALELAGITRDTKSPEGGEVQKDANGEPTGILKETAQTLIPDTQASLPESRKLELIAQAFQFANSKGITSAHDMAGWRTLSQYENLLNNDQLSIRIFFGVTGGHARLEPARKLASEKQELAARVDDETKGPMLEFGYVKLVVDGVMSTHTAVMLEPYADAPGVLGIPTVSQEFLTKRVKAVNDVGFPVAIHAIGDHGVRMAFDAFEASGAKGNRIEHVEMINPLDVARFKELDVTASMNPHHAVTTFQNYLTDRVGPEREANAYIWQTIKSSGAHLVLGSDWPTAPFAPLTQIWAAVHRTSPLPGRPGEPWRPQERLSLDEALYGLTMAGAIQSGWDEDIGSISQGKFADFVLLDGTFETPLQRDIDKMEVAATYLGGRVVYQK
ncbi:MAG: amidohydrolase [Pseudomonadota bacterium]